MPNTYNKIDLKSEGHRQEGRAASAGILPGSAVQLQSDGKWDNHDGATGGLTMVLADTLQGKTIVDSYDADDPMRLLDPNEGDHLQVIVKDGQTVAVGDFLVPEAGTGLWIVNAGGTPAGRPPVVKAHDAVSPVGSNDFVRVRVESV